MNMTYEGPNVFNFTVPKTDAASIPTEIRYSVTFPFAARLPPSCMMGLMSRVEIRYPDKEEDKEDWENIQDISLEKNGGLEGLT